MTIREYCEKHPKWRFEYYHHDDLGAVEGAERGGEKCAQVVSEGKNKCKVNCYTGYVGMPTVKLFATVPEAFAAANKFLRGGK